MSKTIELDVDNTVRSLATVAKIMHYQAYSSEVTSLYLSALRSALPTFCFGPDLGVSHKYTDEDETQTTSCVRCGCKKPA